MINYKKFALTKPLKLTLSCTEKVTHLPTTAIFFYLITFTETPIDFGCLMKIFVVWKKHSKRIDNESSQDMNFSWHKKVFRLKNMGLKKMNENYLEQ
jgi:hypothetical protein